MQQSDAVLKCQSITVTVDRLKRLLKVSSCKAFAKITISTEVGSVSIDNLRVVENKKKELWVAPPTHPKDGKFYDDVEFTGDLAKLVSGAVLREYQNPAK